MWIEVMSYMKNTGIHTKTANLCLHHKKQSLYGTLSARDRLALVRFFNTGPDFAV